MGRASGQLALTTGISGGAEAIVLPRRMSHLKALQARSIPSATQARARVSVSHFSDPGYHPEKLAVRSPSSSQESQVFGELTDFADEPRLAQSGTLCH